MTCTIDLWRSAMHGRRRRWHQRSGDYPGDGGEAFRLALKDLLLERPSAFLLKPPEGNSHVPVPASTALASANGACRPLPRDTRSRSRSEYGSISRIVLLMGRSKVNPI